MESVKLVLNGGKPILDSATIPVKWHFSDEVIARTPRYIVICDHEMPLEEFQKEINGVNFGYRKAFAVKDLAGYIQLHGPGRHHFVAIVICGDEGEAFQQAQNFLEKVGSSRVYYNWVISSRSVEKDFDGRWPTAVAEFEVPKELFAQKPETPFSRFIWRWVNLWHKRAPVDECAYRKRKIFAFTLKPFLFLLWHLLTGIFGSLYTVIGAGVLLFIGYRPAPILKNCWKAWKASDDFEGNLFMFAYWERKWRVWESEIGEEVEKTIPIWAVPFIAVLELAGIALITTVAVIWSFKVLFSILFISVLATIVWGLIVVGDKITRKVRVRRETPEWKAQQEKKRIEREQAKKRIGLSREEKYLSFLKENVNEINNVPREIDIKSVMRKVDTVTRFRLSYWGLKAKVCRPFAR